MPERQYLIHYTIDDSGFQAARARIEAGLRQLDQLADQVGPKIKGLFTGSTRSMTTFEKHILDQLRLLGMLTTNIQSTTTALTGLGTAAQTAGGGVRTVNRAMSGVSTATGKAAPSAGKLADNLLRVAGTAAGMLGVVKAVGEIGEAVKKSREYSEETAGKSLSQRDQARELANLMGEEGPTDRVMARIFGTGLQSGLSYKESLEFLEQFEGSVPAGVEKKHIFEADKAEVAAEGAAAAARLGMNPATAGDITGAIAQHVDLHGQKDAQGRTMTAREATAGQLEAMVYGANEGRGSLDPLMRGEIAQAATALSAGRVGSLGEMGAFVGVMSTISKTGAFAGTKFSQLDSALNRTNGNAGKFLESSGVAAEQGDLAKLHKMARVIEEARQKSDDPAHFDAATFLAKQGLASQQERMAIVGSLDNIGVLDERIEKAQEIAQDGRGAMAKNRAYKQTANAQKRLSEVRDDAAEWEQGRKGERIMIARKNAIARLKHMGLLNAADQLVADKLQKLGTLGIPDWLGMPDAMRQRVDDEVIRQLEPAAANQGINLEAEGIISTGFGGMRKFSGSMTGQEAGAVNDLANKGVDVFGNGGGIEATVKQFDRSPAADVPAQRPQGGKGAPAAGGGAAKPAANAHASIDAAKLDAASDKLALVAAAMLTAVRSRSGAGGLSPAGDLPESSGPAAPYRA